MSYDWLQIGWPSVDRPFGLAIWPIYEIVFKAIAGYKPHEFVYNQGSTPLSTLPSCISLLVLYYVVIFSGREIMKNQKPLSLNFLFKFHNLFLTTLSGALVLLFLEQMIPTVVRRGLFYSICHPDGGWNPPLLSLYYINYITKYAELLDTVYLVFKKKPLTFLHTYHHGATALLCYTQMIGKTSVSWIVITLNLAVHVIMYWYYFQSARGYKLWWKKYITIVQILQFVIDLAFVYFASYNYFAFSYFPRLPSMGSCNGEEFAAMAGICIISSYLFLFISFYIATYNRPQSNSRGRARSALAEMKVETVPTVGEAKRRLSMGASSLAHLASNSNTNSSPRSRKA